MAWPCAGPSRSVRRISMSSVPCRSSTRSGLFPVGILGGQRTAASPRMSRGPVNHCTARSLLDPNQCLSSSAGVLPSFIPALTMLLPQYTGRGKGYSVAIDDISVENRTAEEQIHARLRELADELRQLRRELKDQPDRRTVQPSSGLPRR